MSYTSVHATAESSTLDLLDDASLSYFIPLGTEFSVQDALKDTTKKGLEPFGEVERRESLFFDETVDLFLVLKCPVVEEDVLRNSLRNLVVSIEAQIVNGGAPDRESQPASEVVYTGTVDNSEDPLALVTLSGEGNDEEDGGKQQHTIAVWKHPVHLSRPRMRLQSPSAVFAVSASLKPSELSLPDAPGDGYLLSGNASGLNLLEAFANDPAMNGVKPHLSALRVSRVTPITQQAKDLLRPIKSSPKLSLRIYPVAHSRLRFTHLNTAPSTSTVLAMLEVDFTPFFECEIILDDISISVVDGIVEDLTSQAGMPLPVSCVAHDHVTFLYRISPAEADMVSRNPIRDLDITVSATALLQPGACQPRLTMSWSATVDFTVPVNPGYGSTMQPIQRMHRPSQLSIGGDNATSFASPSIVQPDALPSLEAATSGADPPAPDIGITMTFTGPEPAGRKIFPGDEFVWTLFVVNRALVPSAAPRKLAVLVIPRRRRNESRVTRPPSMSRLPETLPSSKGATAAAARDRSAADAVLDENVVHAMQHSSAVDGAEVVCLSADVRVGPLAPGACHVAELRFLALRVGVVGVEAVRVVDLANNEHVDIRELPTVVVEKKQS
ncbi:TRAPP trafficking subunit Trs65-domain-containing protein [Hypoxylon sp. FL1284]|nr:TRAPP trafficking subunit Trs65-domain-containing protein [Hypoxylon sp. FL1284]